MGFPTQHTCTKGSRKIALGPAAEWELLLSTATWGTLGSVPGLPGRQDVGSALEKKRHGAPEPKLEAWWLMKHREVGHQHWASHGMSREKKDGLG